VLGTWERQAFLRRHEEQQDVPEKTAACLAAVALLLQRFVLARSDPKP
jgi:hypothetical protein